MLFLKKPKPVVKPPKVDDNTDFNLFVSSTKKPSNKFEKNDSDVIDAEIIESSNTLKPEAFSFNESPNSETIPPKAKSFVLKSGRFSDKSNEAPFVSSSSVNASVEEPDSEIETDTDTVSKIKSSFNFKSLLDKIKPIKKTEATTNNSDSTPKFSISKSEKTSLMFLLFSGIVGIGGYQYYQNQVKALKDAKFSNSNLVLKQKETEDKKYKIVASNLNKYSEMFTVNEKLLAAKAAKLWLPYLSLSIDAEPTKYTFEVKVLNSYFYANSADTTGYSSILNSLNLLNTITLPENSTESNCYKKSDTPGDSNASKVNVICEIAIDTGLMSRIR